MKQLINTIIFLAAGLGISSCNKIKGEGPVVTEQRTVNGFSRLSGDISGDIYYTPDSVYHVEVSAQRNILDILNTTVKGNELVIEFAPNKWVGSHDRITVHVSGPDLAALSVNGSGDLKVQQSYRPAQVDLRVSGSGSITIPELYTGNITTKISGSGDITVLAGNATGIRTEISGSGTTDLLGLAAVTATTRTSGSGDTYVQVSDYLDVSISGSGDVYYRGNPRIDTKISGSGKVIRK